MNPVESGASTIRGGDAILARIEPDIPSTMCGLFVLKGRLPFDPHPAAVRNPLVPQLTQLLVGPPPFSHCPTWIDSAAYDPADHVSLELLSGTLDYASLFDRTAEVAARPWNRARPLWDVHQFDFDSESVVLVRLHHLIVDGAGAAAILGPALAPPDEPAFVPDPQIGSLALAYQSYRRQVADYRLDLCDLCSGVLRAMQRPLKAFRQSKQLTPSIMRLLRTSYWRFRPPSGIGQLRHLALEATLEDVRSRAKHLDCTINELFVAGVASALARVVPATSADRRARITMPIDIREAVNGSLGNQSVNVMIEVRFDEDPGRLVREVQSAVAIARQEPAILHPFLGRALAALPDRLLRFVYRNMLGAADAIASNVAGPSFEISYNGEPVQRLVPFGMPFGSALNFTLISYNGSITIGVCVDQSRLAHTRPIDDLVHEGFDAVFGKDVVKILS